MSLPSPHRIPLTSLGKNSIDVDLYVCRHIRHMHKDRSVDEPEIKEMIDSQRFRLPELREGVNVIAVQTRC